MLVAIHEHVPKTTPFQDSFPCINPSTMYTPVSRRVLLLVVGSLAITLVSCDQGSGMDDVDEEITPEEAASRISSSFDGLSESAGTLDDGDFSSSLKDFVGLDDGNAASEEWAEAFVEDLDAVIETSDERFQFDASTGEYVWDADAQQWVETGSSDSIILQFPATESATSNNATLTLREYSDTPLTIDDETVYLPTSGNGSISVDGAKMFSLDLSRVDYTTEDEIEVPIPQSFSLEVLTAPHTHTVALNENSSTDYDFSFDLANGDQLVAGISVGAQLATDNYDELEDTDVEQLSGELRIGPDLAVPYTIEVGELAAFDDPTEEQINNRIDATVRYQGQQIARLRYDKGGEQLEVVYSDGTTDPASEFYDPFVDDMNRVWSDYLGEEEFDDLDFDAMAHQNVGFVF
jgi:hypothetical protein